MTTTIPTRLHITPLNPGSLSVVLGPALTKIAKNISFQHIETFPENDYGFLDLPEPEAKTLISKLNGSILRGKKMKVEKARSRKRAHPDAQVEVLEHDSASGQSPKKIRKAKKEEGVIEGHQVSPERKVKRGWTKPKVEESVRSKTKDKEKEKKSKHQTPSLYSENEELLFRTKLPPNKEHLDTSKTHNEGKGRKGKSKSTETVVHEFQNTDIQPAFIRDTTSSAPAASFVDQVGWVDANGDVVEKAPTSSSRRKPAKAEGLRIGIPVYTGAKATDKQLRALELVSDEQSSAINGDGAEDTEHSISSSSSNSPPTSSANPEPASDEQHEAGPESEKTVPKYPSVLLHTPEKVHPLEAIFKKPQPRTSQEAAKPSLEVETTFSFFDKPGTAEEEEEDALPPMPTTPFTPRDMHSRGVRSAAPTPDTAHPSRFTSFASALANPTSKDQSEKRTTVQSSGNDVTESEPEPEQSGELGQSDFEKRFWAERGQNNRAWKARRKTAVKEQRQKENRSRRPTNW